MEGGAKLGLQDLPSDILSIALHKLACQDPPSFVRAL